MDHTRLKLDETTLSTLKVGERHELEQTEWSAAGTYEVFAESSRLFVFGRVRVINGVDVIDTNMTVTFERQGKNAGESIRNLIAQEHHDWLKQDKRDERMPKTSTSR